MEDSPTFQVNNDDSLLFKATPSYQPSPISKAGVNAELMSHFMNYDEPPTVGREY